MFVLDSDQMIVPFSRARRSDGANRPPRRSSIDTETQPLVSVVIPTHNSATFIAEALNGVFAQTYRRFEVIVIDDGSSDNTRAVLEAFGDRIRYVHQDNRGPAAARNAGIRISRGEFVCFLDADDAWTPNKLESQVRFMETHSDVGLLFADAEECEGVTLQKPSILATMIFGADALSQQPLPEAFRKLVVENFVPTSTVMARMSCLAKAGLFDEELQNAEDRDMWLRLAATSEVACVPRVLATKRSHGANISFRTERALRSRIKVWDKARRDFPALAPAATYHRMLADSFQQLGYILLTQANRKEARRCGFASLSNAVKCVATTRAGFSYSWALSLGLVTLSLVPWPLVRSLWLARNYVLGKTLEPWSSSATVR
jgi:glycosyltransferase involved in cell wall biosynthesis